MHNSEVKILFALFISVSIQSALSYPQYSIPFVSRNNNRDNPSRFSVNIKVSNPFPRLFSGYSKDNRKSPSSNEIVNSEKIITVTPNTDAFPANNVNPIETMEATRSPNVIESYYDQIHFDEDITDERKELTTYDKKDHTRIRYEKDDVSKYYDEEQEKSDNNIEVTTDYTTETSTDYESTTFMDDDIFNRSGISSNVVASLLG